MIFNKMYANYSQRVYPVHISRIPRIKIIYSKPCIVLYNEMVFRTDTRLWQIFRPKASFIVSCLYNIITRLF